MLPSSLAEDRFGPFIDASRRDVADGSVASAFQPFWDIAIAPLKVQAIELALSVDLFAISEFTAADTFAARHGLEPSNTARWLDLLWSLGLLDRFPQTGQLHYAPTALAVRHFGGGDHDCSAAWRFRVGAMAGFARDLENLVRSGPSAPPLRDGLPPASWTSAAKIQIAQEQAAVSVPAFLGWLERTPLPPKGRFLDLGGGPGLIAIAFAQHMRGWSATVFDLPEPVSVAREQIGVAGVEDRVDVLGGNLDHDDIGTGYDLIWCSSVLHFVGNPDAVLARMVAALNPGGLLVAAHAELPSDAGLAARVLPYYLPMMLRGRHVPDDVTMAAAMARAGLVDIASDGWLPFPLAPVKVHRGRRP
jgi:2-polyprenyl-3-methyl-5-hydroxy-6-metoxy-1,4-benzoquinol methylase